MKKLAVSIIVTLALSMAAAIAQTGTDPRQGNSGATPSATQPSEQQPAAATNPAGQATSTDTASTDKADKKLRPHAYGAPRDLECIEPCCYAFR